MFMVSKNINNPVLLYVHGGPAFPNYFLVEKYKPGFEDYFTVCYWEQRGGGLSYSLYIPIESMTFEQLFTMDIPTLIPKLDIPVYFFSGKYGLNVKVNLSKTYLEKLQAPVKGFYTFENSAHSPIFEEPEKVAEILLTDVMTGNNTLADNR